MADAQSILTPLQIPNNVKADAFDAYHQATSADDLTARLRKLPLTDSARADLWDAAHAERFSSATAVPFGSRLKPGMSDEEIIRGYGYDPAVIKKAHLYSDGDLSGYISDPNRKDIVAKLADSPIGDMGYGVQSTANGVAQLITHGLHKIGIATDSDTQYMDLMTRLAHDNYEQNIRHGKPGALGQIAGSMVLPLPIPGAAGATAARTAARVVTGGAVAGLAQPVDVSGPNGDYFTEKGKQALTGAVIAPIVHGAIAGAGKAGGAVFDRLRNPAIPAEAQEVLDQAQKHGVDGLTYGDVSGKKGAQVVDTTLEAIPFIGTGANREAQQAQVKTAAGNVAGALQKQLGATAFDGLAEVQAAAAKGDKEAARTLDLVKNAGNDPDKVMQASLNIRNFLTSRESNANYTATRKLAEALPDDHVPAKQTDAAIGGVMKDLQGLKQQTRETRGMRQMFDDLRENLKGDNPYGAMMTLSDQLGAQIADFYQGNNAAVGAPGVQWLQSVKSAVDADMKEFLANPGAPAKGAAAAPVAGKAAANAKAAMQGAAAQATPTAGSATRIPIPGTDRAYDAEYDIVPRSQVQASHNSQTFQPNPDYGLVNERDYNNPANRGKIVENSTPARFDPAQVINTNADAINGATVVDADHNALAGNGRKMMIDRAYDADPGGGFGHADMLASRAEQFGKTAAEVRAMDEPMLVRRVPDSQFARPGYSKQDAIREMNIPGTAALTPAEQAIADSRRVSPETLAHVADRLQERGPDATLAQISEGRGGVEILNKLTADGVIPRQELAKLVTHDNEALTDEGRKRISALMLGRFFRDAGQMDGVAAAARNKLERIAAPVASIEREGEYSLTPHLRGAVDLLEAQKASGAATLDDYLNQSSLFAREKYSPEAIELARQLKNTNPLELQERVKTYADDAKYAGDYQGPGMFGDIPEPRAPRDAFNRAFDTQIADGAAAAPPKTPAVPAPSANFAQSFQRPQNTRQELDALALRHKSADEFYKAKRVPFSDATTARAVKSDEPDQIYQKFVQAGKGDRAQKFYDVLDPKGRAAVRYGMVSDAIAGATDPSTGIFSPKRFVSALEKVTDAQGVFFKGMDKFELDGFKNLMAHTTRAGQYAENPPTGQRYIPMAILGGAPTAIASWFGSAAAAGGSAGTLATIGIGRALFATEAGRNFLLAASRVGPGTRAMNSLVQQINAKLPEVAARATSGRVASIEDGRGFQRSSQSAPSGPQSRAANQ